LTCNSAGTNVTVHKDAAWKESWNSFKENSKKLKRKRKTTKNGLKENDKRRPSEKIK